MSSSKIERLTPSDITVDRTVQRPLDQNRVANIVGSLRLDALGVPTVSRRLDGSNIVVDGQHRFEALKIKGFGDRPMDVTVFEGLALQDEAALFLFLNNTRSLTALQKFRVALVQEEPEAVNIDAIVKRNGYVTTGGAAGSCVAVATLRAIYRRDGGDTLHRTLTVCQRTWGAQKHATHQTILSALAAMLFRYGSTVSLERLSDKLRASRDGSNPTDFLGTTLSLAHANGTTPTLAGGGKLVTAYNSHLDLTSTQRLADWK